MNKEILMNKSNAKIVFVGCVEAGYFCAKRLIKNGIIPSAIVSIDPMKAQNNNVSGYIDFFDLTIDCERYRPKSYTLKKEEDKAFFINHKFDILVVLGWQRLILREIIESLSICGLTIHGSGEGLPGGRGRSPMNWAIIKGFDCFYLSLLTLSPKADGGRILDTFKFDILPADTIRTLYYKNALVSSQLLIKNIPILLSGKEYGTVQDESKATWYPKRTPDDGRIDWNLTASEIERLVRATTTPYPGAFTFNKGNKIILWGAWLFDRNIKGDELPGTVSAVFPDGSFIVKTGDYYLLVFDYDGSIPLENDLLK